MMSRYDTVMKYFLEQKAENEKRTSENIEKYRKGNCELRFVFGDKVPSDATAVIRQKKHQFRFGANLFMLDEFETEEKNRIYREKFPELFNLATLPGTQQNRRKVISDSTKTAREYTEDRRSTFAWNTAKSTALSRNATV